MIGVVVAVPSPSLAQLKLSAGKPDESYPSEIAAPPLSGPIKYYETGNVTIRAERFQYLPVRWLN
jgi:hypothetical protein